MKFTELPVLGHPLLNGTFSGVTTRSDGIHCAVVLLPGKAEDLTWEDAKAWVAEQGGELPTRPVAALLFANVKPALSPEWHWTADQYGKSYAWNCGFDDGHQSYHRKYEELSAVAVLLIPLE